MDSINIEGSVITVGDNNTVVCNTKDDTDWAALKRDLFDAVRRLPDASPELRAAQAAYDYVCKKDKKGLRAYIKSHAAAFSTQMFYGVASGMLGELIKSAIG
mgnify:CR=1 FL=1